MRYHIRTANQSDALALCSISLAAHRSPLYRRLIPPEHWQRFCERYGYKREQRELLAQKMIALLVSPGVHFFVAEDDRGPIGYVGAQWKSDDSVVMKGLFVHPDNQGQGVGAQLLAHALERAGPVNVELKVLKGNDRARLLYERFGFRQARVSEVQYFGAEQSVMIRSAH